MPITSPITSPILTVAETGSTNADLLALARDGGAVDGMWLRAERQTGGRGRQGRTWESPAGNLYASALVRLKAGDPPAPTLALVAAVALAHTIDTSGCPAVRIKWPNDMLVDGAKVAGILLEREGDWVVIGFGVNLVTAPDLAERRTAALAGQMWPSDVATFHQFLADELSLWLTTWRDRGLAPVASRWRQMAHEPGTKLRVAHADGTVIEGVYEDLGADGALLLRLADGSTHAIHAGDVFLI